jgi:hypothetical protein
MLMVCYFSLLLRGEVRRDEEFAYAKGRLLHVFGIREVPTLVGLPCWEAFVREPKKKTATRQRRAVFLDLPLPPLW